MIRPETIQAIGDEIVILWEGGKETFYKMDVLRAESPSAENKGESDLMGNRIGGTDQTSFPGIRLLDGKILGATQYNFISVMVTIRVCSAMNYCLSWQNKLEKED